jgi:hypothetical protein
VRFPRKGYAGSEGVCNIFVIGRCGITDVDGTIEGREEMTETMYLEGKDQRGFFLSSLHPCVMWGVIGPKCSSRYFTITNRWQRLLREMLMVSSTIECMLKSISVTVYCPGLRRYADMIAWERKQLKNRFEIQINFSLFIPLFFPFPYLSGFHLPQRSRLSRQEEKQVPRNQHIIIP